MASAEDRDDDVFLVYGSTNNRSNNNGTARYMPVFDISIGSNIRRNNILLGIQIFSRSIWNWYGPYSSDYTCDFDNGMIGRKIKKLKKD